MWCSASSGHVTPSLTWPLLPKGQLIGSGAPNHRGREQRPVDHRVGGACEPWPGRFAYQICRPLSLEFLISADLWYVTWLHCIAQESFLLRTLRGHMGTQGPTSLPVLCTCLAPRPSKWFQDQNCSLQGTLALPPSMGKPLPQCWLPHPTPTL